MRRSTVARGRVIPNAPSQPAQHVEELILAVAVAISQELERQGVNKAELARRMGRTRGHVTQLLSRGRNLTLASVAEMASALGRKVEVKLTEAVIVSEHRQ